MAFKKRGSSVVMREREREKEKRVCLGKENIKGEEKKGICNWSWLMVFIWESEEGWEKYHLFCLTGKKSLLIGYMYVLLNENQPSDTGRITSSGSGKYEQKSTVSRFTKPEVK